MANIMHEYFERKTHALMQPAKRTQELASPQQANHLSLSTTCCTDKHFNSSITRILLCR